LLLVAFCVLAALVSPATAADDPSPATIRFYRVFAPEDRMKDWPLGNGKYLPIDAQEFERLVSAMTSQASNAKPVPLTAIAAADYEAKLVGERMVGRAALDIVLSGPAPALLSLSPCTLAISKASWNSPPTSGDVPSVSPDPPPEAADPRPETRDSAPRVPKSPNPPAGAALGSGDNGRLGILVERSGRLNLEWSAIGHRDLTDALSFSLDVPPAAANRLFLELPNGVTPTVDRGLVVGSKPSGQSTRRWRIETGGHNRLQLRVVSPDTTHPRRQLALLRESLTYDCSLRGIDVSAQWKLQVYNEPLQEITVLLDPGLQLVSARLGDKAIPWSVAPATKTGARVTLKLPEPIRDADRVVRLGAVGPPLLGQPWRLPRIRAQGLLWQEGSISLLTPEPVVADRITPHNCAQTGTGTLSAPRTGQTMQFQSFDADATLEVSLSSTPAKIEMIEAAAIDLDGQEATARIAAQFRATGEAQSSIEADVSPRWTVDVVESVPPGGVADWSIEPRSNGRQRLTIQCAPALATQRPVQLAIIARRLFASSPEQLTRADLPPVSFRGIAVGKRLVAVRPTGPYTLKLNGDARLKRLTPDALTPAQLALFATKPLDLLFESNARADSLTISLVAQRPTYSAAIKVDAALHDRLLREKIQLHCVPQSCQVDRLLVRLYPRREAPLEWTLSDCGATVSPTVTVGAPAIPPALVAAVAAPQDSDAAAPQDDRVSARRWSHEEETAAGVDPSLETWELTLRRPRTAAFELATSRETALSALPVVASLASLPDAADQQGTVVLRAIGSRDVLVENRRLKSVLPEAAPPGLEQTIRGVYRYDPTRDVAEGAEAAIRLRETPNTARRSAWIKDCRLTSWHHTDGTVRRLVTYDLDKSGCNTLRLALPPEGKFGTLHSVSIDGAPVARQMAGTGDKPIVSIELPRRRKNLSVSVQWMTEGPPLAAVGSLVVNMPEPDLPVLARHWTAWLPPGYQNVDGTARQQPADNLAPDDLHGWTAITAEFSPESAPALRYVRRASMLLFAAVVFLSTAAVGCWTARKRIRPEAALTGLLGLLAAAAVLLPGPYVPIPLGGAFGIVFCLALRWIHPRQTPVEQAIQLGNQAANANPGSTVAITMPLGLLLFAVVPTLLLCGTARAIDWPPRTSDWLANPRDKAESRPAPSRTTPPKASGKTAAAPSAASPPYRVFVPVDAQRKRVGDKVFVPEAFYQELYRHAAAPAEKPPAWLILAATYRAELTKDPASGRLAIDAIRAQYNLRVFDRAARIRIPLRTQGGNLLPGSVSLDGRVIEPESDASTGALAFEAAEAGDCRLEFSLRPPTRSAEGVAGFDVPIPRVAASRLDLTLPADAPTVEVPSALGGAFFAKDPRRLLAELGPTDRLTLRWREPATTTGTRPVVDADQLTWLKIQPGSVLIAARFKLRVTGGQLRQLQLAVDPRLRLLPLSGDNAPSVQIDAESGQTRLITIRWPRPISDRAVFDAAFLLSSVSPIGNIRPPQIELLDVQPSRRWMAVSVDPALDSDQRHAGRLEAVAVADFLDAWGAADSKPKAAYRLPAGQPEWTLSTRPHEPLIAADPTLALSFDEDRIDVLFDAQLSVTSGYVFQHRLAAPRRLKIEQVSVMQDDVDRVQRWSQDKNGITVFLNGPVSGSERLSIRGRLPVRLEEKTALPTMQVENCQNHPATIEIYRRPTVSLSIEGGAAAEPANANKRSDLGRLVKTIAWNAGQPPSLSLTVRRRHESSDAQQTHEPPGHKSPAPQPKNARARDAVAAPGLVRLADVTMSRLADGTWCGAAALDLEPCGVEELDLRLPAGGELVQASVEDMPLAARRIGDGTWRLRLASPDVPQQIEVLFRGVRPKTDGSGRLRFESPTLGDLAVRQTFWTLLLPPSWTAGQPEGAAFAGDAQLPQPRPDVAAGIGAMQTPWFFCSDPGETEFALDCRELASHRWPAAAAFLLIGIASASLIIRNGRKSARQ
jgi:hypothetical protein